MKKQYIEEDLENNLDLNQNNLLMNELFKQQSNTTPIPDFSSQNIEKEMSNIDEINKEMQDLNDSYVEEDKQEETQSPLIASNNPSLDYYRSLLSKAQKDRSENLRDVNMLMGANQIAQGIAMRRGAKIGAGETAVNALRQQADMPVTEFKESQKNETDALNIINEQQMNDPMSDISQFAQKQAVAIAKRMGINEEAVSKLQGMTARQLENLGFISIGSSLNPRLRFERIKDADGKVKTIAVDERTGEIVKEIGQTGYATQFRTAPGTKEIIGLDSSNVYQPPVNITGPEAVSASKEIKKDSLNKPIQSEFELQKVLDTKKYDQFNKARESFDSEVKEDKNAASKLDGVIKLLDEAVKNPAASGQAKTAVAKIFEKGVLTDQDVVRYAQRMGILNQLTDWFSQITEGTFTPELSRDISSSLKVYNSGLEDSLNKRALSKAMQIKGMIDPKIAVQEDDLAKMMYSNYTSTKKDPVVEKFSKENKLTYDQAKSILLKRGLKINEK